MSAVGLERFEEGWEKGGVAELVNAVREDDEIVGFMVRRKSKEKVFGGCRAKGNSRAKR